MGLSKRSGTAKLAANLPTLGYARHRHQQFQIQKTTPVIRPGLNSEANSSSPLKRTESGMTVHATRFNGFLL